MSQLKHTNAKIRRRALICVASIAPYEKGLVQHLVVALDDPDEGDDKNKPGYNSVSGLALLELKALKGDAKAAVPKLVDLVKTKKGDDFYQLSALRALATIAPENDLPLAYAKECLAKKADAARLTTGLRIIQDLGPHGKKAIPDIVALLTTQLPNSDTDEQVKIGSLEALRLIGPASRDVLPVIENLTRSARMNIRTAATRTLESLQK